MSKRSTIIDLCYEARQIHDDYQYLLGREIAEASKKDLLSSRAYFAHEEAIDRVFPLDSALLSQFEIAFGEDLKNVKIHTGDNADAICFERGAKAVTMGQDIYFRSDTFSPDTEEGQILLAHELTHAVQHKQGNRMVYTEDLDSLEFGAEQVEELLGDLRLHNITQPLLNNSESNSLNSGDADRNIAEALGKGSESKDLLDGFVNQSRESIYEIHFDKTGRTYRLSPSEKKQAMSDAWDRYKEFISEEMVFSTTNEKEELVNRFLKIFGGSL